MNIALLLKEDLNGLDPEFLAYTLCQAASMSLNAERFEDACTIMNYRVKSCQWPVSEYERLLFTTGYKSLISKQRQGFSNFAKQVDAPPVVRRYQALLLLDALRVCDECITTILSDLLPTATTARASIAFLKTLADVYRYRAEFSSGDSLRLSLAYYEKALRECDHADFGPADPLRLGVVSHLAVLLAEQCGQQSRALSMMSSAFDSAVSAVDSLPASAYRDATLILQLMRTNIAVWSNTMTTTCLPALVPGTAPDQMDLQDVKAAVLSAATSSSSWEHRTAGPHRRQRRHASVSPPPQRRDLAAAVTPTPPLGCAHRDTAVTDPRPTVPSVATIPVPALPSPHTRAHSSKRALRERAAREQREQRE